VTARVFGHSAISAFFGGDEFRPLMAGYRALLARKRALLAGNRALSGINFCILGREHP